MLCRTFCCRCVLGVLMISLGLGGSVYALQPPADVSTAAPNLPDPHPTRYSWGGEVETITEPGPYYYVFYYTGTVQPDARVESGVDVGRVPIRMEDWPRNRQWLIAKLMHFYQLANGLEPTAQRDLERLAQAEGVLLEEDTGPEVPQEIDQLIGETLTGDELGPPPEEIEAQPAPGPGPGEGGFDARAAAEWTFYLDQLVLWQYYCGRELLNDNSDLLVELTLGDNPSEEVMGIRQDLLRGGGVPRAEVLDLPPRFYDTDDAIEVPRVEEGGDEFGVEEEEAVQVRQEFDPASIFLDASTVYDQREVFIDAAQALEENLYQSFIEMLNNIEQRQVNQERYEEWLAEKREQVAEFAETWRKLREGDTLLIDGTLFLVTSEPLDTPPLDAVNVIKQQRLTPQDLLNEDGTVKRAIID